MRFSVFLQEKTLTQCNGCVWCVVAATQRCIPCVVVAKKIRSDENRSRFVVAVVAAAAAVAVTAAEAKKLGKSATTT